MLELLKERKANVQANTKQARELISTIVDELSFVELDTFRFSKSEFYEDASAIGEGVVTGYARIADNPVYIIAQNAAALKGGMTKAQADKILKCMSMAEKSGYPLINILASSGAVIGEGLSVLDGYADYCEGFGTLWCNSSVFDYQRRLLRFNRILCVAL